MELRTIPISELKFADYNPRKITKENFERLRTSIREFGFTVPCTVNNHPGRENVLIAGHMRTRAAELEGMKEVPCWVVYVDPQKERMLNIALNNASLQGTWDEEMLSEIIVKLNSEEADTKLTGFTDEQIVRLSDGDGMGGLGDDDPDHDPATCTRCKQLRMEVEGHEKRSNHHLYER